MLSNTYGEAAISERTCREWFQPLTSRTVILTSKTGIAVEERKFSKMQNWRHYLSKTRVKIKKNWHDHWKWLNKPFQNASKPWEWFRSKEIGCRGRIEAERCWTAFVCLWTATWKTKMKGISASWLGTKNGFITIIPNAENHGKFAAMLPRRRPNRIFTAPRSCSVFGRTSSA